MSKVREFWIKHNDNIASQDWKVSGPGIWLENENVKNQFTHVIEKSHYDELVEVLKGVLPVIVKQQASERERIFEDAGSPGFDGPMSIETDFDEPLDQIRKVLEKHGVKL